MLKNNIHYFKTAIQNPEEQLDVEYMFLAADKNIKKYQDTLIKAK